MKPWLLGTILALLAAVCTLTLLRVAGEQANTLDSVREEAGETLAPGVTLEQALALSSAHVEEEPPRLAHPPEGAQQPFHFPAPTLRWRGDRERIYRVELSRGGEPFQVVVTRTPHIVPDAHAWDRLRRVPGPIVVTIRAGVIDPDGRVVGAVTESRSSFSMEAQDAGPSGVLVVGMKHRPPSETDEHVPLMMMHLAMVGMDLEELKPRVLFRTAYGPELIEGSTGAPRDGAMGGSQDEGPPPPGPGGVEAEALNPKTPPKCVSCHDISQDGRYIATFSQVTDEGPPEFDVANGFLTVLAMPEREVIAQVPHGFLPRFNPADSNLIAYADVDETIGAKTEMLVKRGDIVVLDLESGVSTPVPGASESDRVEAVATWSPDGQTLAFLRTAPGEMWHGSETRTEIATVPWAAGAGGVATPLDGVSGFDQSHFYPEYSPDGRWLVATRADRGFFSQISSDLVIVPAAGGVARRLACNSPLADTWHRFSPDGRWLAMISNRTEIRHPDVLLSRFDTAEGTCQPPVEIPHVAGPAAHMHAFHWVAELPWLRDGLSLSVLEELPPGQDHGERGDGPDGYGEDGDGHYDNDRGDRRDGNRRDGGYPDDARRESFGSDPPPPGAADAIRGLLKALEDGDTGAVGQLFITRELFLASSECEPSTQVESVMEGREQALQLAAERPRITDVDVHDGMLEHVLAGSKPYECRALRDVLLFRTTWTRTENGRPIAGEAHLLEIDGRWYFARI